MAIKGRGIFFLVSLVFVSTQVDAQTPSNNSRLEKTSREIVVVLHGLGRTSLSMMPMQWYLEKQNYLVDNWNYDGFLSLTDELSDQLITKLTVIDADSSIAKIHFVTHSYGGIIVRNALSKYRPAKLGRFVQLAPPNRGADIARRAEPYLGWILRPLKDLQPGDESFIMKIPRLEGVEIAVIQASDDIVVGHSETLLDEAREVAMVESSHTFIMANADAQALISSFIQDGKFSIVPSLEQHLVIP